MILLQRFGCQIPQHRKPRVHAMHERKWWNKKTFLLSRACADKSLPCSQAVHITNLPRGIFPPRSLTRQDDWPTKITCDIAHAIPRVGEIFFECCSKIHLRKVLKNCLFSWFVYFEASARTFLQGKGILLKLLKIACQSCERQTAELVQFVMYAGNVTKTSSSYL